MTDNARIVREALEDEALDCTCGAESDDLGNSPGCHKHEAMEALDRLETELATAQAALERAREEAGALHEVGQMVLNLTGSGDSLVDAQFIIAVAIHPWDYDQTTRECALGKALSAALAPEQKGE